MALERRGSVLKIFPPDLWLRSFGLAPLVENLGFDRFPTKGAISTCDLA